MSTPQFLHLAEWKEQEEPPDLWVEVKEFDGQAQSVFPYSTSLVYLTETFSETYIVKVGETLTSDMNTLAYSLFQNLLQVLVDRDLVYASASTSASEILEKELFSLSSMHSTIRHKAPV